ncbi:redoxin domain-containing protein [Rhizobium lusitanum]|uniref:Redoxin domain-containing protein n=1 Tax=Rhizobium lusitanum TaxID=293958 RepID=A0A6L9ULX5_9HYPH|nr:SCO family protein [Rhizobium lusitanum]NEI74840.1 redoxin domain-containing protein [Rhizobium lusitanum]
MTETPLWSRRSFCALVIGAVVSGCKGNFKWRLVDVDRMYPDLDFQMIDVRTGRPVSAQNYRGKLVVLFFGYTFCPEICPTTLLTLTSVMDKQTALKDEVNVLFVSVDLKRDTQAVLKQYVESFAPNVTGLSASENELAALARRYRVAYTVNPGTSADDYTVDHTATVFLFDRDGRLRLLAPYGTSDEDFDHDLELLAQGDDLG